MRKLILVLLLLLALPLAAAAAPEPLALPEFANRLEGAAAAVEQNRPGEARQLLADQVTVAAPGGPIVVDMRWATANPAASLLSAQQRTRVAEQLRAMAREARQVDRAGQPGLDARLKDAALDRQRLDQILQPAPPPQPPAWVRRLMDALLWGNRQWQRLADWWGRQFAWVPDMPGMPTGGTSKLVGAGVLLVLLTGGLYWVWVKRRRKGTPAPLPAAMPADMRRAALAAAESGNVREAIKLLMQAVLGRLVDRSLIAWQPFLTNRGCVSELRRCRPELAPALEELNRLYEWKVYGDRPASESEFRRGMALADHLWEEGSPSVAS